MVWCWRPQIFKPNGRWFCDGFRRSLFCCFGLWRTTVTWQWTSDDIITSHPTLDNCLRCRQCLSTAVTAVAWSCCFSTEVAFWGWDNISFIRRLCLHWNEQRTTRCCLIELTFSLFSRVLIDFNKSLWLHWSQGLLNWLVEVSPR